MRHYLALASGAVAIFIIVAWVGAARPQETQLAPEGRGLLPKPAEMPATLGGTPPAHPFTPDSSGGFSRTIFETNADPNFKIIIRDYSFPPDKRPHTLALRSAAFLHVLGTQAEISIAKRRMALTPGARTAVAAGAPIDVVNNGETSLLIRALIVEAK